QIGCRDVSNEKALASLPSRLIPLCSCAGLCPSHQPPGGIDCVEIQAAGGRHERTFLSPHAQESHPAGVPAKTCSSGENAPVHRQKALCRRTALSASTQCDKHQRFLRSRKSV